jgi:peptide/nickel transport system permease protein
VTLSRKTILWSIPALLLVLIALSANKIAPYGPNQISDADGLFEMLATPSTKHLLGTNALGMDLFSRTIHGTQAAVLVSLLVIVVAMALGVSSGLVAGWFGGWVDRLLRGVFDFGYAMPGLLLSIALGYGLSGGRPSFSSAIVAVAIAESITFGSKYFFLVRATVLSISKEDYVTAAVALGAGASHIMLRHLVPNSLGQTVPLVAQSAASAISSLAGLGFLGLGIGYGAGAEWGFDLAQAIGPMLQGNYWPLFASAAPILLLMGWLVFGSEEISKSRTAGSMPSGREAG